MGQLLAFVLTLSTGGGQHGFWVNLALISLFVQWVALGTVLALCATRPLLTPLSAFQAATAAWLITLGITLALSLASLAIGRQIDWDHMSTGIPVADFLTRTLAISAIVSAVALRYLYVQSQWKNNLESETRSRIQALQARIRPHFLFNSMNTIASLTRTRPEVAESTVMDLADLFRATLSSKDTVSFQEEVKLTQNYLRIESLRLGDRLQVDWRMEPSVAQDFPVPSLTLQPLLENAIYHGIEPLTEGGCVRVDIRQQGERLDITIENPMPPEQERRRRPGNQFAQESVRQRLALAYQGRARMNTLQSLSHYRVDISLPRRMP
ncbi:sensor histidine kinase [Ectothiorhodospira shaposhnikovii]|uniref:sensor histidine kinase n=1 Tax=Ectothiorhodospira shaposhnikovii TaxID=1054 RepID=UPI001F5B6346|nr:histidine kinase [Ectothiorhodospira shaposhnikovii]